MTTPPLLKVDPAFGTKKPYPSESHQWREYHTNMAWLFNPYTGDRRHPADVGSDPFGCLIKYLPPLMKAAK